MSAADERRARIALTLLTEAGSQNVGRDIQAHGVAGALAQILQRSPRIDVAQLEDAVDGQLRRAAAGKIRLVMPGGKGWPRQLDDLGDARPLLLWVRGSGLRTVLLRSVSIVGARACSPYGRVQAETIAADLGLQGWAIVSGGAFGIDAAAHAGALAVGAQTVLVTAGGVDVPYPRAHEALYERVAAAGAVVSEFPLGSAPARRRFLFRNRVIAAMTRGTVVVEAAMRSGARSTAASAAALNRHVMALPGPVQSDLSVGCHALVRSGEAVLVTNACDVLELVTPVGEAALEGASLHLMRALARRKNATTEVLAKDVGLPVAEAQALLTSLEGIGLVGLGRRGWSMSEAALDRWARVPA